MGVGAVAEGKALVADSGGGLEVRLGVDRSVLLAEVVRDGAVVSSGLLEGLEREAAAGGSGNLALSLDLLDDGVVVIGGADDRGPVVVLGRSAEKSDTANVNLLNGTRDRAVRLLGLEDEGVEVADNDRDLVDLVVGKVLQVRVDVTREDTTVNSGVERLNAAAEDLGSVGDGRDIAAMSAFGNAFSAADTHSISMPFSRISLAVPPEPRRRNPRALSSFAKGRRLVLS